MCSSARTPSPCADDTLAGYRLESGDPRLAGGVLGPKFYQRFAAKLGETLLFEAVNGRLQMAERMARGFRDFHLAAYLGADHLDLHVPNSLPT